MDRLQEIKQRAMAATPGPWEVEQAEGWAVVTSDTRDIAGLTGKAPRSDAQFIATARTDVPILVAAIEAVLHAPREVGHDIYVVSMDYQNGYNSALEDVRQVIESALGEGK